MWCAHTGMSREGKAEEEQQEALKHMLVNLQYSAKEMLVKETSRRADVSAKAVRRLLKQHLAQAWAAWVDSIYTYRAVRQTVCWMGERMARRGLARTFDRFAAVTGTLHAQRLEAGRSQKKAVSARYEGVLI